MKQAVIVVYRSRDRRTWEPVLPADVPEWVKDPDVMGRLVSGEMAKNGRKGPWFRAEKGPELSILLPKAPNLRHKPEALAVVKH